jgi:putative transposase
MGQNLGFLSIVDNFSKKCLSLFVGKSLKGGDVVEQLSQIKQEEMLVPTRIQCDNGSEFISKEVDRLAYENGVILDFSRPGKPTDNTCIESIIGKFRDECLSVNCFLSLEDAKEK